ncbi:arsenate reductase ArsC [Sulfitobacter sp. PS-8MA]|uniref:arsenate reductase ArsC n=1 Tax=Sulfitobacter sp. PS-8MA TaxID=3237707 RepID=UPI0034C671EB
MNILVLCTGNSARSILLEALLRDLGAGRLTVFSAGSQPAGQVHPGALRILAEHGHDTHGFRSKSWDEFAAPEAPRMDLVITVCGSAAAETCPLWPGTPLRGHWGVEDPAAASPETQATAFADAYAILRRRAEAFVAAPVTEMDRAALQAHLSQIGMLA